MFRQVVCNMVHCTVGVFVYKLVVIQMYIEFPLINFIKRPLKSLLFIFKKAERPCSIHFIFGTLPGAKTTLVSAYKVVSQKSALYLICLCFGCF